MIFLIANHELSPWICTSELLDHKFHILLAVGSYSLKLGLLVKLFRTGNAPWRIDAYEIQFDLNSGFQ